VIYLGHPIDMASKRYDPTQLLAAMSGAGCQSVYVPSSAFRVHTNSEAYASGADPRSLCRINDFAMSMCTSAIFIYAQKKSVCLPIELENATKGNIRAVDGGLLNVYVVCPWVFKSVKMIEMVTYGAPSRINVYNSEGGLIEDIVSRSDRVSNLLSSELLEA